MLYQTHSGQRIETPSGTASRDRLIARIISTTRKPVKRMHTEDWSFVDTLLAAQNAAHAQMKDKRE